MTAIQCYDSGVTVMDNLEREAAMPTYHRLESPSQSLETAIYQTHSNEIWGAAARGSLLPSVKAYVGPLPAGADGIEFDIAAPANPGGTPTTAKWYLGRQPAVTVVPGTGMCKISVVMLKVVNLKSGVTCVF